MSNTDERESDDEPENIEIMQAIVERVVHDVFSVHPRRQDWTQQSVLNKFTYRLTKELNDEFILKRKSYEKDNRE